MIAPLQYDGRVYKFIDKLYKSDSVLENPEYLNAYLSRANTNSIKRISMCSFKQGKIIGFNPDNGLLDLDFVRNDSNQTRINSEGQVENACYNLVSNSKTFSDFTSYAATSINTNLNIEAPNEELTAIQIQKIDINYLGSTGFSKSLILEKNKYYNYSCYLKYVNYTEIFIKVQVGTVFAYLKFNIQTGNFLEQANTQSYSIQPLKNGWYKVDICFLSDAVATNATIAVDMVGATNTAQVFYIWGPQVSLGKTVRPYLATTNRTHVPAIDYSIGQPTLLLEPSRTNFILNSDEFETQSLATDVFTYTLSFYGTGSITLSGSYTGVLNGLGNNTRAVLTFTGSVGTLLLTKSGIVTKAQLELSSFPTSYIRTQSTTVTRAVPSASTANLNLANATSSTQGTWYIHARKTSTLGGNFNIAQLNIDGSQNSPIVRFKTGVNNEFKINIVHSNGSFEQSSNNNEAEVKIIVSWNSTSVKSAVNNALGPNASGVMGNLKRLDIGPTSIPIHIIDMWFSPDFLSDAELLNLTKL